MSALIPATRRIVLISGPVVLLGLWYLPIALDSRLIAGLIWLALASSALWGWWAHQWRPLFLLAAFAVFVDSFGLAQTALVASIVLALLWMAGIWTLGHIGQAQPRVFDQALVSFLVIEIFAVLRLWPVNALSKAVIVLSFALFLWHECVRLVSARQRLYESVFPFLLIVALMTFTARWLVF